jgi:hypothetical protein
MDLDGDEPARRYGLGEGGRNIVFSPLRVKNRAMGAAEMLHMASEARRGTSVGLARCGFALGLALGLLATSRSVVAEEPITAVWREQKLSFTYDSSTSIYACDALAGRVRSILRAVGARDDVRATASNCNTSSFPNDVYVSDRTGANGSIPTGATPSMSMPDSRINRHTDLQQFQVVHIQAMVPVVVTPEVLKELEKDKSKRELIARVTGNQAARFNDPVAFQAQWQPVTLSHKTIGLEPEECELLEQMANTVFPKLGVRVVRRGYTCDPGSVSHIPPELVAEALLPVPYGGPHPPPVPMKDDKDGDEPAESGGKPGQ